VSEFIVIDTISGKYLASWPPVTWTINKQNAFRFSSLKVAREFKDSQPGMKLEAKGLDRRYSRNVL
jgi:hypothetical protein